MSYELTLDLHVSHQSTRYPLALLAPQGHAHYISCITLALDSYSERISLGILIVLNRVLIPVKVRKSSGIVRKTFGIVLSLSYLWNIIFCKVYQGFCCQFYEVFLLANIRVVDVWKLLTVTVAEAVLLLVDCRRLLSFSNRWINIDLGLWFYMFFLEQYNFVKGARFCYFTQCSWSQVLSRVMLEKYLQLLPLHQLSLASQLPCWRLRPWRRTLVLECLAPLLLLLPASSAETLSRSEPLRPGRVECTSVVTANR